MQKEIHETPKAIINTYYEIKDNQIIDILKLYNQITFTGCGTAYHSCLIGEYLLMNGNGSDSISVLMFNSLYC